MNFAREGRPVKVAMMVLTVIVALLSVAAGAAKIALVVDEVEFLSQFGFNEPLTMAFDAVQVLGGLLMLIPFARLYGAIGVVIVFTLSEVLILISGNLAFAALSAIPVALSGFIIYFSIAQAADARFDPGQQSR